MDCQACTPAKRCAYHVAEDEILGRLEDQAMTIALYDRQNLIQEGSVMDLLMKYYDAGLYWEMQRQHRAGEQ